MKFSTQFTKLRSQFRHLIDDFRPDIFYVNAPRLVPAACSLGNSTPPIVFHTHNYLKQRYAAALTGRFLRHAGASVIGNCNFVLEPLRPYLTRSNVEVIFNGVPDYSFRTPRPRIARIGILGRICPEKGQKVFVQAAREFSNLNFVICGGTQFDDSNAEPYFNEVRDLAAGLPIEFTGWRDDVSDVLHTLDLLVVASMPFAEATTRVIPEAWSAGVPVLASDLPGIREILTDSQTGFLFPPGDAQALASRIKELVNAPEKLATVTINGRRHYEENFQIDGFQRRIIANLEKSRASAISKEV